MKAFLEPVERHGPKIRLTRRISVVGRLPGSDIRIDHVSLSRRHAVLVIAEGLVVVRDLITTNGTKVNGKKVRWAALMPNDLISFGTQKYRIVFGPDTKYDPPLIDILPSPEIPHHLPGYLGLFETSDPMIRPGDHLGSGKGAEIAQESLSDWEFEDSQNTELGGWRPGRDD